MPRTANPYELAEAMKGRDMTSNWDVVVSYTNDRLNKVLGELWVRGGLNSAKDIKPQVGEVTSNDYMMRLHKPRLNFVAEGAAVARLDMDISGECWEGGKATGVRPVTIHPGTFGLSFEVPLVSVPSGAQMKGNEIPDKLEADSLVHFKDNSAQNIIFHFKAIDKWKIETLDKKEAGALPSSIDVAVLSLELHSWFQETVRDVEYPVAQVNKSSISDNAGFRVLEPQSFVFASHGTKSDAVLSIYIKVKESGYDPGDLNPVFPLTTNGDLVYKLVPEGYEASVLIRYDVMLRNFLDSINSSASLPNSQPAASDSRGSGEDGFRIKIKVDSHYIKDPASQSWFDLVPFLDWIPVSQEYGKKFNINLIDNPLNLRIQNKTATWWLNYDQSNIMWQRNFHWAGGGEPGTSGAHLGDTGVFDAKVTVDRSQEILTHDSDISGVTATFTAQEHFKFKFTPRPDPDPWSKWSIWKQMFYGRPSIRWQEELPSKFNNLTVEFDKPISFSFQGLNFLLTTNVFANPISQNIIKIDTGLGLLTPHDALLVGQVVEPSDVSKRRRK